MLFTDATVTGIVDYGALAEDHGAVDLARLLGDLAGNNDELFTAGLQAYHNAGGDLNVPAGFVRLLDRSGVVCSVIGWVVRLLIEQRSYLNPDAVVARLRRLIWRAEQFAVP